MPFVLANRLDGNVVNGGDGLRAAAQANAFFLHARGEQREKTASDGLVDQNGFHGIAGGGIVGLGVVDDVDGHVEVRGGVDVDVADAFGMAEHGDARIGLDVADQVVTAARNDQIDEIVELAGVRDLGALLDIGDQRLGKRKRAQRGANIVHHDARGAFHLAAGLENDGVRGFDGQRSDLRDGFGARFKNDREQAQRAAHLFQFEAGVEFGAIEHAADGVGQSDDGANAFDHGLKLVRRELQAVDQSFRRFAAAECRFGFGGVLRIGSKDFGCGALERAGDLLERLVALAD